MPEDTRYRTKVYLEDYLNTIEMAKCDNVYCASYWVLSKSPSKCPYCDSEDFTAYYNLTKDDNTTTVSFIAAYADPDYPLVRVFIEKSVDLVFCISEPTSTPLLESNLNVWGYEEHVPIEAFCIDKTGITGTKLKAKADAELRLICEEHPFGSVRTLTDRTDSDQKLGSTIIHGVKWVMNYRRRKQH